MDAKKVVLLAALTALASVVGQASAATSTGSHVHCSWRAVAQGRSYHYEGTMLGSVRCSRPLGNGRFHGKYQTTLSFPVGTFTATESDHARLSFMQGLVVGIYRVSGRYSGKFHNYHGTFHVTRGTGRFRHATGTLQVSCTVRIPTEACDASGSLAGIRT